VATIASVADDALAAELWRYVDDMQLRSAATFDNETMRPDPFGPVTLTPLEFEQFVASALLKQGVGLQEFTVQHLERLKGTDGEYVMDVTARFEALGANFLVLVECKHLKRPVERDVVQVLADKIRNVGAQKGMLFATAGFQRGALEYARKHGIALVHVTDGRTSYQTRSAVPVHSFPAWLPRYVGWISQIVDEGTESFAYLGEVDLSTLRDAFEAHAA
jgi:restriction system protein